LKYDFETITNRSLACSHKWNELRRECPELPPDTVPFSMADMEWKNAPAIVEGVADFLRSFPLGYSGIPDSYLQAVQGWMSKRHQWEIDTQWVVPVPGVLPGLFAALQEFTQPGNGILYFSPVFGWFCNGTAMNERKPVPCSLCREDGSYAIDFRAFEQAAANPKNKALIFCNPHNPTGHIWMEADLIRIYEICKAHDLLLISDEIHSDLVMPGFKQISFGQICADYPKLIVCTAPTKTFNLAGMQVGNLIIPNAEARQRMQLRLCRNGLFTLSPLAYKACEIAYTQCDEWLDECITYVWSNHQALKSFLAKHLPEVGVSELQATYLQWLDFRALEPDAEKLKARLYQAGVVMDHGPEFGPEGVGFERMNMACPQKILMDALERMAGAFH